MFIPENGKNVPLTLEDHPPQASSPLWKGVKGSPDHSFPGLQGSFCRSQDQVLGTQLSLRSNNWELENICLLFLFRQVPTRSSRLSSPSLNISAYPLLPSFCNLSTGPSRSHSPWSTKGPTPGPFALQKTGSPRKITLLLQPPQVVAFSFPRLLYLLNEGSSLLPLLLQNHSPSLFPKTAEFRSSHLKNLTAPSSFNDFNSWLTATLSNVTSVLTEVMLPTPLAFWLHLIINRQGLQTPFQGFQLSSSISLTHSLSLYPPLRLLRATHLCSS